MSITKAILWRCFILKVFLKIYQNLQDSNKFKLHWKKDSGTGASLWIFRKI